MKIHDLSIVIKSGMPTYPGDPGVFFKQVKLHERDGINILSVQLGTHTGTHVDVPKHHLIKGKDTENFALEKFIGEAIILNIEKGENEAITLQDLEKEDIRRDDIVIIYTGWERNVGKGGYFENFPYFSEDAADYLIYKRIKTIGCDLPSVDAPGGEAPSHHKILGEDIGIIEALQNLKSLCGKRVFFIGLPLTIAFGDGSPIRAIAVEKANLRKIL